MKKILVVMGLISVVACTTYPVEQNTEEVSARVLTKGEAYSFNLGEAVVGYLVGRSINKNHGLPSGLIWRMASSKGCRIPLIIGDKPQTISAPRSACRELKENDNVVVIKTTALEKDKDGNVVSKYSRYGWKYN